VTAVALLAALLIQAPQDPAYVSASLSAARVTVSATTTLRIEVESRGTGSPDIERPRLPVGLEVVGTSDFSQLRIARPGQNIRSTRREFVILATAPGVYQIPAVQVIAGGQRYLTEPLDLTVTGPARPPVPGAAPPGSGAGSGATTRLHLHAEPDTVFVGQQVTLEVEAVFAEESRFRQSRPASFEPPATSGFWIQDLPDPVTVNIRVSEGRSVETQVFRRAYFPMTPGVLWFPPAYLHYELRRGFLQPPETRRVASDSLAVVVRPLPEADRPAAFAGAVGRYEIAASVAPARVAWGQPAVLTVEVRGAGNVRSLPQPRLPELEGVDVFQPTQEATVEVENNVVGGVARFRWMLVPERPRTHVIPPINFAYFDPELRTYVSLRTDSLVLEAMPSVAAQPGDTAIRPLRLSPGQPPAAWARSGWFAGLQLVPLVLVAAAGVLRRRRDRQPGPLDHARRIRRRLAEMRVRPDEPMVPGEVERLMREAIRLVAEADGDDPAAALRQAGMESRASEYTALVEDLRRARYAPGATLDPLDAIARADAFIDSLRPRRRGRASAALIMLPLAGLLAMQLPAHDAAEAEFAAALASHLDGDVVTAANAFHRYARLRPQDPAGWYNLGVSAYAAGDPGRGVWAWLRAARIAPRDADIRHNLALTASPGAVAAVVPPDRLAVGERAAAAAAAWWLCLLGLASALLRRRSSRLIILPAAVALLVFGVAAGAAGMAPRIITPLGQGAAAFAGPSIHDDRVGQLDVGSIARLVERRGQWLLVRLGDGRLAWVERARVAAP
jgi:hypothetical protein